MQKFQQFAKNEKIQNNYSAKFSRKYLNIFQNSPENLSKKVFYKKNIEQDRARQKISLRQVARANGKRAAFMKHTHAPLPVPPA